MSTKTDEERLLSTDDVAEMAGVTRRTVQTWRNRGTGPRYERVGNAVVYRLGDVVRWLRDDYQPKGGAAAHKKR